MSYDPYIYIYSRTIYEPSNIKYDGVGVFVNGSSRCHQDCRHPMSTRVVLRPCLTGTLLDPDMAMLRAFDGPVIT